jgi:hypothetical protein
MPSPPHRNAAPEPLPEALRGLFWEYDFDELSWEEDRDLIFKRVLSAGPWDTVRWLRRHAGDEALRAWIRHHQGRSLSRRQLRFWQLILDLPPKEVDAWLEDREPDLWERRWAVPSPSGGSGVSQPMLIEVELPETLEGLRLPTGVNDRLQSLLARQDRGEALIPEERKEAEGLVDLAELLSLLRLHARRIEQETGSGSLPL